MPRTGAEPSGPRPRPGAAAERPVILLHGLARTRLSVEGMRRHLEANGFATWSHSYPTRKLPIDALADWLAERIRRDLGEGPVMAVTHSLGGVVLRFLHGRIPVERAVLVAPPIEGSRVARALRERAAFRLFYGPAGQAVGGPPSHPAASGPPVPQAPGAWPDPPQPFAVIAGTRATSPAAPLGLFTRLLGLLPPSLPSDGVVAVEETRHPLMAAHAQVDATHTWILDHPETRRLAVRFLRERQF